MMKRLFGNRWMIGIWTVLFTFLIGSGINYFTLVPMSFSSSGFWWFCMWMTIIAIVISYIFTNIANIVNDESGCDEVGYIIPIVLIVLCILWIIVMFITSISGWKMTNAEEYAKLVTIEEANFEEDIPNISENQDIIVYVDQKTAQKLGDRTLGNVKNSSWYNVDDEYNLVCINGKYYRISPVNYNGYFSSKKVRQNGGIPGYVSVDVQTQEATFVYFNEGEKMIYSPSGNFSYDLNRLIYKEYPKKMLGKSFFEVDDKNHPYWITEVRESQIGMRGGVIVKSFIITDATSGKMKEYTIETLPSWVDQAYSVNSLMQIIDWHYYYQNGYWNFSKTDRYKTTYLYRTHQEEENKYTPFDGYNTGISKNGEIIFYTGITPDNSAETNIGFVSANPRTGEVRFYSVTGAEESSAQVSVEGLVSNMKYSASFPILINVDGEETYFMVLKDSGGLVQRYALCNIKNYSKRVESDNIDDAINKYKKEIGLIAADSNENISLNKNTTEDKITETDAKNNELVGLIVEVKEAQLEGYTYYYFTIEGSELIFMSSIENSNMQPLKLKSGVNVTIQYYESEESGIGIVKDISF